ncbi:hypothetical protein [Thermoflexibacter ruber]|uniref:DUF5683 domain-containing protein n=1 Tax=Thermoflexibacter ruber TaxID=1003 RepID=A0A1I2AUA8_9BACT|nr:hypothetical protein [Thermoflexibacter ruber]SFE47426.1 hypothetical protein SAMN04488541_10027 [Thermoflexibacter ruber]
MKKYYFLLVLFLGLSPYFTEALAQTTKTVPLRGITVQSDFLKDSYYYGTKKLNSSYDLTIPFMEIGDKEVDRLFQSAKTMRTLQTASSLLPLLYFSYALRNTSALYNLAPFYWVLGGSLSINIGLGIWGRANIRKAIHRYNELIMIDNTPQAIYAMPQFQGVHLTWRYKF